MLSRLNGIFAFAIWDTQKRQLFLARDGTGVKPLYYTQNNKGFIFASELKALLCEPSVEKAIDYESIQSYVSYLWCPAPRTMLKDVKKLEPGHAMIVKDGKIIKKWEFYDLPYSQNVICNMSESDAIHQTRHFLQNAVRRQMVSDVPVGAFLSGGLDSSAIVAFASKYSKTGQKFPCFTIGFKDKAFEQEGYVPDLPYAKEVAKLLDLDLQTIYVGPEISELFEKMIYHLDEPQADTAPITTLLISQLARSKGIKVLLSGTGGDDIFAGYRRHYAIQLEKYWRWIPKNLRKNLGELSRNLPIQTPLLRRLAKLLSYISLDGDEKIASYFHWIEPRIQNSLYSDEVSQNLKEFRFSQPLIETLEHLPKEIPALNRMLYLDGKHFLPDHNLNYTDKMSMAAGVEVRVPFLDPELVDFATKLPLHFKQHGSTGKWILRQAMEPHLPKHILYRSKSGFGTPLRYFIKYQLENIIDDLLAESSIKRRGIFNPNAVRQLLLKDRAGKIDAAYPILSLICIEWWCRLFIDNPISLNETSLSEFHFNQPIQSISNKKLNVLIIGTIPPPIGGISMHIQRFYYKHKTDSSLNLSILDIRNKRVFFNNTTYNLFYVFKLLRKTDIIHIHFDNSLKVIIALIFKILRKKVVYTHHGSKIKSYLAFIFTYYLSNKTIYVNNTDIPIPSKFLQGRKSEHIPAFIIPSYYEPLPEKLLMLMKGYSFIICANCFRNNLYKGKNLYGFDVLIQAFSSLVNRYNVENALVLLVDPSNTAFTTVHELMSNCPLRGKNKIEYIGYQIDFSSLIKVSNVVVRPTRTDGDALTIREALFLGKHVIASNCVWRPEGTILYETENYNELADKIYSLYSNKNIFPEKKNYDFGKQVVEVYKNLLPKKAL